MKTNQRPRLKLVHPDAPCEKPPALPPQPPHHADAISRMLKLTSGQPAKPGR